MQHHAAVPHRPFRSSRRLLSYESVIRRDYPVVLGSLYVFTIIGLLTTLIRDLSYLWVDPRVKFFD